MRFQQMRPLFMDMSDEERRSFISKYREQRAADIADYIQQKAAKRERKPKETKEKIILSPEEKILIKKLGITPKDLLAMKEKV